MNYKQFVKQPKVLKRLCTCLGIISQKEIIMPVDINPDDAIIQYDRHNAKDYYFLHDYPFQELFHSIIKAGVISTQIYNHEILQEALEINNLLIKIDPVDITTALNRIHQENTAFFRENGYETDELDEYKLHKIRIQNIDNQHKKLYYEGGFFGDGIMCDYETFAQVQLEGVPTQTVFYKELLGESCVMFYLEHNYKMAFFLAFTAFECFINSVDKTAKENIRLSEKITRTYQTVFNDLNKCQIYTSIINDWQGFEKQRNDIAHGNDTDTINISLQEAQQFLIFCLTMIIMYDRKIETFDKLVNEIP